MQSCTQNFFHYFVENFMKNLTLLVSTLNLFPIKSYDQFTKVVENYENSYIKLFNITFKTIKTADNVYISIIYVFLGFL